MEENEKQDYITLRDILNVIKKNIILICIITAVVIVIGSIYTFGMTKNKYYSEGSIIVEYQTEKSDSTYSVSTSDSLRYVNTVAALVTSDKVLQAVKEDLKGSYTYTVSGLKNVISTTSSTDSMIITIKVTTNDGAESQAVVKAIVDEVTKYSKDSTSDDVVKLYCSIKRIDYGYLIYNGGPNRMLYLVITVLAGLVIAIAVVLIKEFASNKFKTKEEIENLGYSVIGVKTDTGAKEGDDDLVKPSIRNFEPYNRLLSNIKLANVDDRMKVIMVTSTVMGELKTTVLSNLAYAAKNNGAKSIILDLDIRKPRVHKVFGVKRENGVVDYLEGQVELETVIKHTESGVDVISAGKSTDNPVVVLESHKLNELIQTLKETYDYVFIDTPPVMACCDAETVAKIADGVVYNVAINMAKKKDIKDSIETITSHGGKVIGINVTKVKMSKKEEYYYYQYGYNNNTKTK